MLSQQAEEFRSEAMLQNYCDAYPDLSYHHHNNHHHTHHHHQLTTMPPAAGDYGMVASGPEQPWYNTYIHGGIQNGGDFFGRDKMGAEWSSYHHHHHQESDHRHRPPSCQPPSDHGTPPYIPQHVNTNTTPDGQYHHQNVQGGMQAVSHLLTGQQMQMEPSSMMLGAHASSSQDPLMINDVSGTMLTNGVDTSRMEPSIGMKEEDALPRLDGPQATMVSNEQSSEQNKDVLKLPGFHQTFGNITEIGRFSQHDDYFESGPSPVEQQQQLVSKVSEQAATEGKRKTRGRKRKQPQQQQCQQQQPEQQLGGGGGPGPVHQEQCQTYQGYPHWAHPYQQRSCQSEPPPPPPLPPPPPPPPHWRPHPYYHHHHHHHHNNYHHQHNYHNGYTPPPYHQYPDYNTTPHHYNYPSSHYQPTWPPPRDYAVHNYTGYV